MKFIFGDKKYKQLEIEINALETTIFLINYKIQKVENPEIKKSKEYIVTGVSISPPRDTIHKQLIRFEKIRLIEEMTDNVEGINFDKLICLPKISSDYPGDNWYSKISGLMPSEGGDFADVRDATFWGSQAPANAWAWKYFAELSKEIKSLSDDNKLVEYLIAKTAKENGGDPQKIRDFYDKYVSARLIATVNWKTVFKLIGKDEKSVSFRSRGFKDAILNQFKNRALREQVDETTRILEKYESLVENPNFDKTTQWLRLMEDLRAYGVYVKV